MASVINTLKEYFRIRSPRELFSRCLELIFGYPLYWISFLFIRNRSKWCFGTNVGFIDNAKYFFIYVSEQTDDIHPIWISSNDDDVAFVRSLGLDAYKKYSFKGIYHCLTAGVYIFTYHSKDINFFTSGNVKKVNLWHGVGIKGGTGGKKGNNISAKGNESLITRITLPHLFEKCDLFLSTSDMMDKHFTDMFSLEADTVFDCIYPRCYYMIQSMDIIEKHIEKFESQSSKNVVADIRKYDKAFLYMPTWRGNLNDDFIKKAGFDFDKLDQVMARENAVFIFKLHPAVRVLNNVIDTNYQNIIFLDKRIDVYPLLPFVDALITDYSSIYYDFILLNKGVLLYPFDKEEFLNHSNDLAFDYDEYTPGRRAYDNDELLEALCDDDTLILSSDDRARIIDAFWGNVDINTLQPLYNKIKQL